MKAPAHRWIVVAAIINVSAGAALSDVIEPGVRVEKIMLTTNTPTLRLFPATAGQHPIALLAHGCPGSKEMMFRFGEALAAAGFDCYSEPWVKPLLCMFSRQEKGSRSRLDPIF